ncbi:MAG: phage tail protein [Bryobacterales bacterium]|nr:phage tail protein [Bryobacterales bacterium]
MSEPFIGEIRMFGGNFAPKGWAFCDGRLLAIATNSALFSILGTTYGGNGTTTFALPDLRGRVPMSFGNGPGLTPRVLGEMSGEENHTLISTEMPQHNHLVLCNNSGATGGRPGGTVPGVSGTSIYDAASDGSTMNPSMVQPSGGSQAHNNIQPYTVLNFIIALEGIYPSRN